MTRSGRTFQVCLIGLATVLTMGTPSFAQAYKLELMAVTGVGFSAIDPGAAINNRDTVAFVGQTTGAAGNQVFVADKPGITRAITFAASLNRNYFGVSISDGTPARVATRDRFAGSPPDFFMRTWPEDGSQAYTLIGRSPGDFDSAQGFPDINDSGTVAFPALIGGSAVTALFVGDSTSLSTLAAFGGNVKLRPQISNGPGVVVYRDDIGAIQSYDGGANVTIANQSDGFNLSAMGVAPGISKDGSVIAFIGELTNVPNLGNVLGVFLSVSFRGVREIVPVAAVGAQGFTAIDSSQRVAVTSLGDPSNTQSVKVVYAGTRNGKDGVFSNEVDLRSVALTLTVDNYGPQPVAVAGDVVGGKTISSVALFDPLNDNGVVAFTAGFSDASQGVVRATPFCHIPGLDPTDTDGDGLPDKWETDGIDWDGDGTVDLRLEVDADEDGSVSANERADPNQPDLFLEVDYMEHHRPSLAALANVTSAFANAPRPIRLHILRDEQAVTHAVETAFEPDTSAAGASDADFDLVKQTSFGIAGERPGTSAGNARRCVFRYALLVHDLKGLAGTSGAAELPGNDLVVSLGSGAIVGGHPVGNRDQTAGTLMHELGHTLRLRHGGGDEENCKPNYLSVMSYTRQFNNTPIVGRKLDYSRQQLTSLDENNLNETSGIGGVPGERTAWGPVPYTASTGGAIDWNKMNGLENGVAVDLNYLPSVGGCTTQSQTTLDGYEDWSHLLFDFKRTGEFADGARQSVPSSSAELTIDDARAMSPDTDGDGALNIDDDCPLLYNPGQDDADEDAIGDACDPLPHCGDGTIDPGEQCDDGNMVETDGCNESCEIGGAAGSRCGDGVGDPGEECDDGNVAGGDGCSASCRNEPRCGNGVVETGEQCDDENLVGGDGCSATCRNEPRCGNAVIDAGEQCDDGNVVSGDGCSSTCQIEPRCGNALVEPGEQCDDGNLVSGDGCSSTCVIEPRCGNGVVDAGEQCDDGNTTAGDGCSPSCQNEPRCGNGIVEGGGASPPSCTSSAVAMDRYGKLPLAFEANAGQSDPAVRFLSRSDGATLFLTDTEMVLSLAKPDQSAVVRMSWAGGNPHAESSPLEPLPGTSNYVVGNDPANWRSGVARYGRVRYRGVYPGTDLVFHGDQRALEYDFVVSPGASPKAIRMAIRGAEDLRIDRAGNLIIDTAAGEVVQHAPVVYQEIDGARVTVPGRYVVSRARSARAVKEIGFKVARYDRTRPLVIDPTLAYSTYLGGFNNDQTYAIAVDGAGSAYVAGFTGSPNFPTVGALQGSIAGNYDVFVAKLAPGGDSLIYSTYLGGSTQGEEARAIAVDAAGSAYVTGHTYSTDFPTTVGAFQTSNFGSSGAFVSKLSPGGNTLVYSTYLGGSGTEFGLAIAVDATGSAYVTGETNSGIVGTTAFPTTVGAFRRTYSGGFDDLFVTKLSPAGNSLVYSTYLGGSTTDLGLGIAVDAAGSAYVTGYTDSTNFPTAGALQGGNGGGKDAFVAKLSPTGNSLSYSSYLGGNGNDEGRGVALDSAGSAYVTGNTTSTNFPTAGAFQGSKASSSFSADAFVAKLSPAGNSLAYSTYLGGGGGAQGNGIAVDASGSAYVTGIAGSNFPTADAIQGSLAGGTSFDAFVTKLSPAGDSLAYSTYLGGYLRDPRDGSGISSSQDLARGIAIDAAGNAYITGYTTSTDFPTAGALQGSYAGGIDAFVAKLTTTTCGGGPPPAEECDDGARNGTIESCCSATCQFKPAATSCDDTDACTRTDQCDASGVCVGANPVTCAAADPCHLAGACDPASGACSSPVTADGTSCSDGDSCTRTDTCQSGACVGSDPVICVALDPCHDPGICDPRTGVCSNPSNACDQCPGDPLKTEPGVCGCGVADTDGDGDGTLDCNDPCPADATKATPGVCGCGIADTDGDGDGIADCNDSCSADATKTAPGVCGCGVADTDGDGDGIADCNDPCPADPAKTAPGVCGCGVQDAWSGFLPPIHKDGSSTFKLGSTIPVKFRLTGGCSSKRDLVARIYIAPLSGGVTGSESEATSTSAANQGNAFRYDASEKQYIFNLATKPLSAGEWRIRVDFGDGVTDRTVNVSLKGSPR